ncbi:MAG: hypothetical protein ABL997_01610 [Planctomycetota bacterium]
MHLSSFRNASACVAAALTILASATAQDTCATAIPIVGGVNGPFSNVGMTNSTTLEGAPAPTCVATSFDRDFWLVYTANCNGTATFSTCTMTAGDTTLAVYSGTCGALVQLGCSDDSCGARSQITGVPVVAGGTYYLRLDTFGTAATLTTFLASVTEVGSGVADECNCAPNVVNGANGPFDNTGSTTSSPAWTCGLGANDLWFRYVATCCGDISIDTCGSALDTVVQAFSGSCGSLVDLGCNDDANVGACVGSLQSQLTISGAVTGQAYLIRVAGFNGNVGAFGLNISCTTVLPVNDECLGALPVSYGANGPFSSGCATNSTPAFTCASGGKDLWYDFTPSFTAPHTLDVIGAGFDTILEVYDACGGTSVACNDDAVGLQSRLTASLTAGVTYKVRVGGFLSASGSFPLNIRTGTTGGSITPNTTVSLCPSPATLNVTGDPWIGGTLSIDIVGATGLGFTGYGFSPLVPIPSPCGCDIISDGGAGLGFFQFLSTFSLPIPVDPFLIGATVQFQGLDVFPSSGGCTFSGIPFGATNIWTGVIG